MCEIQNPKAKIQGPAAPAVRDRIRELRRVPAGSLRPNPKNWRRHPAPQRAALEAVLREVGFAGALLVRELDDGTLELIDGHLRAELIPEQLVPVLVLDVNQAEADKLLLTLDPLAAMAEAAAAPLNRLLSEVDTGNPALQQMLAQLARQSGLDPVEPAASSCHVPESFALMVECQDEDEQRELYQRLVEEGYSCRVLTL